MTVRNNRAPGRRAARLSNFFIRVLLALRDSKNISVNEQKFRNKTTANATDLLSHDPFHAPQTICFARAN
jgi:hypothetical protein